MNVAEAIDSRMSCRAFQPTPVPEATVRTILETARRSPSGGNLQPWHVHVLTGAPLAELVAIVRGKLPTHPRGEGSEYDIYPRELWEPYRSRRFKCGEDLYATINVTREDKLARLLQFARNYQLFGAPVGLFFFIDRQMGPPQWSDLGMYMQSVMLLEFFGLRREGAHPKRTRVATLGIAGTAPMQRCESRVPVTTARMDARPDKRPGLLDFGVVLCLPRGHPRRAP